MGERIAVITEFGIRELSEQEDQEIIDAMNKDVSTDEDDCIITEQQWQEMNRPPVEITDKYGKVILEVTLKP